ncbi:MAG: preprotein translocase subunit SecA [bacterium]|jgi:preprotein translocase subunit SecA
MAGFLTKIFGTKSGRDLKKIDPVLEDVNDLYLKNFTLSDAELRRKTEEFKQDLAEGRHPEDVLPEAFAAVKEMTRRMLGRTWEVCEIETAWNMVPFDVQVLGAIVLNEGRIAEMATGEGKTLVATMPLYFNALTGKGSHLVTVNDYLARRDSQWMGKVYELMGLTVGCIQHDMMSPERIEAYRTDITYGTNNEFGFDYLRDNMATRLEERVQRGHHYAIVDEVDSILIDEARTPLIISGPAAVSTHKFEVFKPIVARLYREQIKLVNGMLADAERSLEAGDDFDAGAKMLCARRGAPKNRKLFRMMEDGNLRKLVESVETDLMREKRLHEIDEELYFAIDEKSNTAELSEMGRRFLEKNYRGPRSEAERPAGASVKPDLRIERRGEGVGFSTKTEESFLTEGVLNYLSDRIYPHITETGDEDGSLFLLHDSALGFQRIDSEVGKILKEILFKELRPEMSAGLTPQKIDEFLARWTEHERRVVPALQVMLRRRFETDYAERSERLHNISQLLKAYSLFEKDVNYVVKDGKVLIVDVFTGRLMPGRRYSDGLHQALEAKEGVTVERETQTHATITIQNYFRLYEKLAGMTGTAETEAGEFDEIYKLDVVVIPTNEPVRRADYEDVIYLTKRDKYNAVIDEIVKMNELGRPVLVGTVSVEVSETLGRLLKRRGIEHSILNAKYHEQEARIVANAGESGAVTIATNMAGRGTDIKLDESVVKCEWCCYKCGRGHDCGNCPKDGDTGDACFEDMPCGLHIIGTERHESRRIDRQLRGRSGRQGDPGSSRFYLSLEDDLMRLFGSDRYASVIAKMGLREGDVIEHPLVSKAIGRAQKRVEANNFSIRKHLLEYDDVMNKQREVVYAKRLLALESEDISQEIREMIESVVEAKLEAYAPAGTDADEWDIPKLRSELEMIFMIPFEIDGDGIPDRQELRERAHDAAMLAYEAKQKELGFEIMKQMEQAVMLYVIDNEWRDHLYELDGLRSGISLRAYGQKDPLLEYKGEAYDLFVRMSEKIDERTVTLIFRGRWVARADEPAAQARQIRAIKPQAAPVQPPPQPQQAGVLPGTGGAPPPRGPGALPGTEAGRGRGRGRASPGGGPQVPRPEPKVGRNDPCPCGSGKKYKKCCGR